MIHTHPYVFVVLFAIGAGALALWFDVRFPSLAPERLQTIIVHALLSMLALDAGSRVLGAATDGPHEQTVAVLIGVMLPALVYTFVVCVWMMKLFSGALRGSMR